MAPGRWPLPMNTHTDIEKRLRDLNDAIRRGKATDAMRAEAAELKRRMRAPAHENADSRGGN